MVSEANSRQSACRRVLVPGLAMWLGRAQLEKATWHILPWSHSGGGDSMETRRPRPGQQRLSLEEKGPELVWEIKRYQLDLVGLASTQSQSPGRGWMLVFSRNTLGVCGNTPKLGMLKGGPCPEAFNSHLQRSFSHTPVESGGIELNYRCSKFPYLMWQLCLVVSGS